MFNISNDPSNKPSSKSTTLSRKRLDRIEQLLETAAKIDSNRLSEIVYHCNAYPHGPILSEDGNNRQLSIMAEYDLEMFRSWHDMYPVLGKAARSIVIDPMMFDVNEDHLDYMPRLWSVGYEGLDIDQFLTYVLYSGIKVIFDVRERPQSRKFGFSKSRLEYALSRISVDYRHVPAMGVPKDDRDELKRTRDYDHFFMAYADSWNDEMEKTIHLMKSELDNGRSIGLMCFERQYCECHRSMITKRMNDLFNIESYDLLNSWWLSSNPIAMEYTDVQEVASRIISQIE